MSYMFNGHWFDEPQEEAGCGNSHCPGCNECDLDGLVAGYDDTDYWLDCEV